MKPLLQMNWGMEMESLNELPLQEHIKYLEKQKKDIEKSRYLTPHQFRTWKYLKNEIERLKRKNERGNENEMDN